MSKVEGTPRNFAYTLSTRAERDTFWHVWTDVEKWSTWDSPLAETSLEGEWGVGAVGHLTTKSGQSSTFTVTEYDPQNSYAFATKLPGASLVVRRYFTEQNNDLYFTHRVSFEGALAVVFAQLLGRGFRRDLPPVMENLVRVVAEVKSRG